MEGVGNGDGTFWFSLFTLWSWQEFQVTPPTRRYILSKASYSATVKNGCLLKLAINDS
jgi:hypothetical protein